MLIQSILTQERTRARISSSSKKKILEQLAKLYAESYPDIDWGDLCESLFDREKLGSTGIGQGIAIPHCRFDTKGETLGACISLETPVPFDSVDNEPVDIVFSMLVPQDAESSHLEALASLAESLQKPDFVSGIRKAQTDQELFNIAISSES